MSPLRKLFVLTLIYKYWIRDLIIEKIRYDYHYDSLLKFTDDVIGFKEDEKNTKGW